MTISFPPALIAKLKNLLADQRHDLSWHHKFGRLVEELIPKKRLRDYSAGNMQRLAKRLGKVDNYALVLYQHRDFVDIYKYRDLPKLNGLTFAHICVLQGLGETPREEFRRRCLKWEWSVRQLRAKVQECVGKRSQGGKETQESVDVGPQTALRRIAQMSDVWQKHYVVPLEKNLQRLMRQINRKPTIELLELAEEGRAALKIVLEKTNEVQLELDRLIRKAKKPRRQSA